MNNPNFSSTTLAAWTIGALALPAALLLGGCSKDAATPGFPTSSWISVQDKNDNTLRPAPASNGTSNPNGKSGVSSDWPNVFEAGVTGGAAGGDFTPAGPVGGRVPTGYAARATANAAAPTPAVSKPVTVSNDGSSIMSAGGPTTQSETRGGGGVEGGGSGGGGGGGGGTELFRYGPPRGNSGLERAPGEQFPYSVGREPRPAAADTSRTGSAVEVTPLEGGPRPATVYPSRSEAAQGAGSPSLYPPSENKGGINPDPVRNPTLYPANPAPSSPRNP